MSAGTFTVFVPKFVNETAPVEMKGVFGAMINIMAGGGIFFNSIIGLAINTNKNTYSEGTFIVDDYWRVVLGMPIFFSVI